jgi:hypothetical protein
LRRTASPVAGLMGAADGDGDGEKAEADEVGVRDSFALPPPPVAAVVVGVVLLNLLLPPPAAFDGVLVGDFNGLLVGTFLRGCLVRVF